MFTALMLLAASDPGLSCLPVPEAVRALGDEAVTAYRDELAKTDKKAPAFKTAPADARLLLKLIFGAAAKKEPLKALRPLMEQDFTFSFGDAPGADKAIETWSADAKSAPKVFKAALQGSCTTQKDTVTCAPKKAGPRLVLEKRDGCWRWTAFVAGD